jgi:hypothetical protein
MVTEVLGESSLAVLSPLRWEPLDGEFNSWGVSGETGGFGSEMAHPKLRVAM